MNLDLSANIVLLSKYILMLPICCDLLLCLVSLIHHFILFYFLRIRIRITFISFHVCLYLKYPSVYYNNIFKTEAIDIKRSSYCVRYLAWSCSSKGSCLFPSCWSDKFSAVFETYLLLATHVYFGRCIIPDSDRDSQNKGRNKLV